MPAAQPHSIMHLHTGAPCRLDKALETLIPDMGLRGRRRLIERGAVLVMGRPRAAGYVVREGAEICIRSSEESAACSRICPPDAPAASAYENKKNLQKAASSLLTATDTGFSEQQRADSLHPATTFCRVQTPSTTPATPKLPTFCGEAPRFLEQQGGYCFFFKPAGLHSVALRGGDGPSLESLLPRLLDGVTLAEEQDDLFLTMPSPQRAENTGLASPATRSQHMRPLPATPRGHGSFSTTIGGPAAPSPTPSHTHEGAAPATAHDQTSPLPVLIQRLDQYTSGIVAAALRPAIAAEWRDAETHGLCCKRYLALLCGDLPDARTATAALDTQQRRRTRVLTQADVPLRHTVFTPLAHFSGNMAARLQALLTPENAAVPVLTLAGCTIRKGARHQIRAHAAALGLPLWGDALYGGGEGHFFLHHGGLDFLDKHLTLPPRWLDALPAELQHTLLCWLDKGVYYGG